MESLRQPLGPDWRARLHWVFLALMALALIVPLGMVESVVAERHALYRRVLTEIAGLWSGEQVLTGPILAVPFTERFQVEEEHFTQDGARKVYLVEKTAEKVALVLPRDLELAGTMEPSYRHRGLYEARVYELQLRLSGRFEALGETIAALTTPERLGSIHWERAIVVLGVTEPKGIARIGSSPERDDGLRFEPGTRYPDLAAKGTHARVPISGDRLEVSIDLVLRGSDGFRWTPVGERSRGRIASPWSHPSFYGELVPATYETGDAGFTADWDLPLLVRSYPQSWISGTAVDLGEVTTGVRLFEPVALYDRVTRSVKYGLLFVVLTFLSLGLIELASGARIRYVQYLLIGLALALFFLVLIAFAEHLGFPLAYLIAASTVVAMNGWYCLAVLPRRSQAALVTLVLGALYGVLYAILQAEDYALLSGTLLLAAALAACMYFTRRPFAPRPGGETGPGDRAGDQSSAAPPADF